ncbi:hypothetical protein L218DRAFT_350178 [Marasmius fiardii PR-910]|nr:hypothetical protein L218DRAFT_350178 [Marasmius fiardii PR-910]
MQRVDDSDLSRFLYSKGGAQWQKLEDPYLVNSSSHSTTTSGSFVTFQFSGTYVEVRGTAFPRSGSIRTRLLFNLDSNHLGSLYTPALNDTNSGALYDLTFFKSDTLNNSEHTLVINYINIDSPPVLWLDYIDYAPSSTGANSTSISVSGTSTSTPTTTNNNAETSHSSLSTAAIAGISVAAGFVALFLLGFGFLLWRRRKDNEDTRRNMTERARRITSFDIPVDAAQSDQTTSQSSLSPLSPLSRKMREIQPRGSQNLPNLNQFPPPSYRE